MNTITHNAQATRALLKQPPEDSFGVDGSCWYGLYPAHKQGGGFILIEDDQGNLGRVDFDTNSALMLRWQEIATTPDLLQGSEPFEPEEDEPENSLGETYLGMVEDYSQRIAI